MIKLIAGTLVIVGIGMVACTKEASDHSDSQKSKSNELKITGNMKNLISIVEIPTEDFSRAIGFYQAILDIKIEEIEMDGVKMGLFPTPDGGIFVQVISGADYKPSSDGTLVYLNGGDDLQKIANKIEGNGGKIILPKTAIGPDMGFYAMFIDTEGNKLGLYSSN